jgi:hypothetical protein
MQYKTPKSEVYAFFQVSVKVRLYNIMTHIYIPLLMNQQSHTKKPNNTIVPKIPTEKIRV